MIFNEMRLETVYQRRKEKFGFFLLLGSKEIAIYYIGRHFKGQVII